MRAFRPHEVRAFDTWSEIHQVIIPLSVRKSAMKFAHNGLAGHLGIQKICKKVLQNFHWPGMMIWLFLSSHALLVRMEENPIR